MRSADAVPDAPVYTATLAEMDDLEELLARANELAMKYGAVRIDPPAEWTQPPLRMKPDSRFFVRMQTLPAAPFVDPEMVKRASETKPPTRKRGRRRTRVAPEDDEDNDEDFITIKEVKSTDRDRANRAVSRAAKASENSSQQLQFPAPSEAVQRAPSPAPAPPRPPANTPAKRPSPEPGNNGSTTTALAGHQASTLASREPSNTAAPTAKQVAEALSRQRDCQRASQFEKDPVEEAARRVAEALPTGSPIHEMRPSVAPPPPCPFSKEAAKEHVAQRQIALRSDFADVETSAALNFSELQPADARDEADTTRPATEAGQNQTGDSETGALVQTFAAATKETEMSDRIAYGGTGDPISLNKKGGELEASHTEANGSVVSAQNGDDGEKGVARVSGSQICATLPNPNTQSVVVGGEDVGIGLATVVQVQAVRPCNSQCIPSKEHGDAWSKPEPKPRSSTLRPEALSAGRGESEDIRADTAAPVAEELPQPKAPEGSRKAIYQCNHLGFEVKPEMSPTVEVARGIEATCQPSSDLSNIRLQRPMPTGAAGMPEAKMSGLEMTQLESAARQVAGRQVLPHRTQEKQASASLENSVMNAPALVPDISSASADNQKAFRHEARLHMLSVAGADSFRPQLPIKGPLAARNSTGSGLVCRQFTRILPRPATLPFILPNPSTSYNGGLAVQADNGKLIASTKPGSEGERHQEVMSIPGNDSVFRTEGLGIKHPKLPDSLSHGVHLVSNIQLHQDSTVCADARIPGTVQPPLRDVMGKSRNDPMMSLSSFPCRPHVLPYPNQAQAQQQTSTPRIPASSASLASVVPSSTAHNVGAMERLFATSPALAMPPHASPNGTPASNVLRQSTPQTLRNEMGERRDPVLPGRVYRSAAPGVQHQLQDTSVSHKNQNTRSGVSVMRQPTSGGNACTTTESRYRAAVLAVPASFHNENGTSHLDQSSLQPAVVQMGPMETYSVRRDKPGPDPPRLPTVSDRMQLCSIVHQYSCLPQRDQEQFEVPASAADATYVKGVRLCTSNIISDKSRLPEPAICGTETGNLRNVAVSAELSNVMHERGLGKAVSASEQRSANPDEVDSGAAAAITRSCEGLAQPVAANQTRHEPKLLRPKLPREDPAAIGIDAGKDVRPQDNTLPCKNALSKPISVNDALTKQVVNADKALVIEEDNNCRVLVQDPRSAEVVPPKEPEAFKMRMPIKMPSEERDEGAARAASAENRNAHALHASDAISTDVHEATDLSGRAVWSGDRYRKTTERDTEPSQKLQTGSQGSDELNVSDFKQNVSSSPEASVDARMAADEKPPGTQLETVTKDNEVTLKDAITAQRATTGNEMVKAQKVANPVEAFTEQLAATAEDVAPSLDHAPRDVGLRGQGASAKEILSEPLKPSSNSPTPLDESQADPAQKSKSLDIEDPCVKTYGKCEPEEVGESFEERKSKDLSTIRKVGKSSNKRKAERGNHVDFDQDERGRLTKAIVFPDSPNPISLNAYEKKAQSHQEQTGLMLRAASGIAHAGEGETWTLGWMRDVDRLEEEFWTAMARGIGGKPITVAYGVDVEAEGAFDSTGMSYVEWHGANRQGRRLKKKRKQPGKRRRSKVETDTEPNANGEPSKEEMNRTAASSVDVGFQQKHASEVGNSARVPEADNEQILDAGLGRTPSPLDGFARSHVDDPICHVGNLNRGGLLRHMPTMPGINHSMYYVGQLFTRFCWHTEDAFLNSVSYLHRGSAEKIWYAVPPKFATAFEEYAAASVFSPTLLQEECDGQVLLMNKTTMFDPRKVLSSGVEVYRVVHKPGSFVLTAPRAYHAGFNCGFNIAEAVNFANPTWFPVGREASSFARQAMKPLCVPWEYLLFHEAKAMRDKFLPEFAKGKATQRMIDGARVVATELKRIVLEGEKAVRRYAESQNCRISMLNEIDILVKRNQLGPEFGNGAGMVCSLCAHACHFYAEMCGSCEDSFEARCVQHFGEGHRLCLVAGHKTILVRRHDPVLLLDILVSLENIAGIKVDSKELADRYQGYLRPWQTPMRSSGLRLHMDLKAAASRAPPKVVREKTQSDKRNRRKRGRKQGNFSREVHVDSEIEIVPTKRRRRGSLKTTAREAVDGNDFIDVTRDFVPLL